MATVVLLGAGGERWAGGMLQTYQILEREVTQTMVVVVRRDGESLDQLLRRFRKAVTRDRVLTEARRHRHHITKGERERIKKRKGIQRAQRRARRKAARLERRRNRR